VVLGEIDSDKEENGTLQKITPSELTELLTNQKSNNKDEWDFE